MARYYPNGSGNNRKPKEQDSPVLDPGVDESVTLENNAFSEWLYGDYDENKFRQVSIMLQVPGLRQYINYLFDYRANMEYFNRYGMSWSDIHDPRKLSSSGSFGSLARSGINFVSDIAKRLYR